MIDFKDYHRLTQSRKKRDGTERELELYFAPEPLPADAPVYLFQHVQKTGGTSVRAVIHHNLTAQGAEFRPCEAPSFQKPAVALASAPDFYQRFYASLTDDEQARLSWVVSHSAGYLIPWLQRPARPVTVVREPVDKVLSRFWFGGGKTQTRTSALLDALYRGETVDDAPLTRQSARGEYANSQTRWLLRPFYDVDGGMPVDRDPGEPWAERLRETAARYTLLRHDRLAESMARFGAVLGWQTEPFPHLRRNTERLPADELEPELRERIARANRLDAELYRLAG